MLELLFKNRNFILFVPSNIIIKSSNWRFKKEVIKKTREKIEMDNGTAYILNLSNYLFVEEFINKLSIVIAKTLKNTDLKIHPSVEVYIDNRKLYLEERQKIGKGIIDELDEIIESDEFLLFNSIVDNELERNLRHKQRIASFHTAKMRRTMNFSVPGSGKTSMVYGTYAYLSSQEVKRVNKIVIIAPLNAARAWREEFTATFGEKRKITYCELGSLKAKDAYLNVPDCEVNFINYEKVGMLEEFLYNFIDNQTLLVLDEVHRIKNPKGVRAMSVMDATERAGYITTLTGTPLPNKYTDIYNMMNILFRDDYAFFGYDKSQLIEPDEFLKEEIKAQLEPFFFRVTKEQLGVPKIQEDKYYYATQSEYEKELFDIVKEKDISYLAKYIFLQQTEMNPSKASFLNPDSSLYHEIYSDSCALNDKLSYEELEKFKQAPVSNKLELTFKVIKRLVSEGKPVIVWCNFRSTMSELSYALKKTGINAVEISGGTEKEERDVLLDDYKSGKIKVLISNPQTLAESVSLHDICHDAIYCELNLNLAQFVQSKDRIHRLGLPKDQYTQYHYIFAEYNGMSLDYNTLKLLEEKEEIMNKFLEQGNFDIDYYGTSEEEIKKLLEGDLVD